MLSFLKNAAGSIGLGTVEVKGSLRVPRSFELPVTVVADVPEARAPVSKMVGAVGGLALLGGGVKVLTGVGAAVYTGDSRFMYIAAAGIAGALPGTVAALAALQDPE